MMTKKIQEILKMVKIKKDSYILDVGCGTGIMINYLKEKIGQNGRLFCVDISEKMIEIAKKKFCDCENLIFINDDVNNLSFRDYFDLIMCYSVFPHFEDKKNTLKNLTKMLKKGGVIVIAHSQSRKEINELHRSLPYPINTHLLPNIHHIRLLSNENLAFIKAIDDKSKYLVIFKKI